MSRRDLVDMYCTPEDYNPPLDKDLTGNTQYPNLNSEEYRRKFCTRKKEEFSDAEEFYEALIRNSLDQVLVVTSDYRRRLWCGSFWLFPSVSAYLSKQSPIAQHQCQSSITTVTFQSKDKVLFGTATGGLELWELMAAKNDSLGVYKIESKSAHFDVVSKVVLFPKNEKRFVSSSYDGTLKIWELDNRDLMDTNTYHGAHLYAITDISTHPEDEQFVSVSRDKSALIWDHRQVRPATGLLNDHPYHLTSCNWTKSVDNPDKIVIGNANGEVLLVDRRVPDKVESLCTVFDRPIRKIDRLGDKWIICGNSTEVKMSKDLQSAETIFEGEEWVRDTLVSEEGKTVHILSMNGEVHEVPIKDN